VLLQARQGGLLLLDPPLLELLEVLRGVEGAEMSRRVLGASRG